MNGLDSLISFILKFLAPIILMFTSVQFAIMALFVIMVINYITSTVNTYKRLKQTSSCRFILWRSIWNEKTMKRFFTKSYEYIFAMIVISLFQVYIIGLNPIEINLSINLLNLFIFYASTMEITQIFNNIEKVSGNNIFEVIKNKVPMVGKLFGKDK